MWGRGGRSGRHAAPGGRARRAAAAADRADHGDGAAVDRPAGGVAGRPDGAGAPGLSHRAPADRATEPAAAPVSGAALFEPATAADPAEPLAIIGGSAITLLAGRIRRRHTIADLESPTTELRLTLPTPRVRPAATPAATPAAGAPAAGTAPPRATRRARRPGRGRRVPVTAAVIGTLAVAAVITGTVAGSRSDPVTTTPSPPTVLEQPAAVPMTGLPVPDRAAAYLGALRSAEIPASRSGTPETEAATAICEQSRRGVPDAELVRSLPALLTDVDRTQAPTVVELAKRYYCP